MPDTGNLFLAFNAVLLERRQQSFSDSSAMLIRSNFYVPEKAISRQTAEGESENESLKAVLKIAYYWRRKCLTWLKTKIQKHSKQINSQKCYHWITYTSWRCSLQIEQHKTNEAASAWQATNWGRLQKIERLHSEANSTPHQRWVHAVDSNWVLWATRPSS